MASQAPAPAPAPAGTALLDRAQYDAKIEEINARIDATQAKIAQVTVQIESLQAGAAKHNDAVNEVKSVIEGITAEQSALESQKKALLAKKRAVRDESAKAREQLKALRASLPFSSVEAVDAKLEDLEHQLTTTSLPLAEERALVKQIETLRRQRQQVAEVSGAGAPGGAAVGEILDGLSAQLTGVFAQLDEVRERLNAQWEIRRTVEGRRKEARGNLPQLYKQRDSLRDQLRADIALRKSTKEESFKARQAARKAAEERRKAREAEYEARKAAQRAEEAAAKREEAAAAAARHPHEQELATADVLAAYMRAVMAQGTAEEETAQAGATGAAAGAAASVPAAGLKPMGKKHSADVDELNALATSGKGKKARKARKAARGSAAPSGGKDALVMDVPMLQQLAQVGLPVPRRAADIPDLLTKLEGKVAAWKAVPMPTAAQVEAKVAQMVGPAEGAQVSTPYGAGTLSSVRAEDGIHVVKLAGFAGTGYLRPEDVQSGQ